MHLSTLNVGFYVIELRSIIHSLIEASSETKLFICRSRMACTSASYAHAAVRHARRIGGTETNI
jgi:hypothetical protein